MIKFKIKQFLLQISFFKIIIILNVLCRHTPLFIYKNDNSKYLLRYYNLFKNLEDISAIWRANCEVNYFS